MTIERARFILDLVREGRGQHIDFRVIRLALLVTGDARSTFKGKK